MPEWCVPFPRAACKGTKKRNRKGKKGKEVKGYRRERSDRREKGAARRDGTERKGKEKKPHNNSKRYQEILIITGSLQREGYGKR